jgi:Raf kinase inhibitor-like YbhB/YbcL family protein
MMRNGLRLTVLGLTCATSAVAQQGDGTQVHIEANIWKPAKVEPTPERIKNVKGPAGFSVNVFARDLKNIRIIAVAPNGTIYVTRRDQGDVLMLKDQDGDGIADGPAIKVASRSGTHGIAIHDGKFYLVTVKEIFVGDIQKDDSIGPLKLLVGDLPDAGQHADRTIAFGPDGMLYISVGSTCNDCNENNPENATMLRANPDLKSRSIFASGLRNTIGFDWQPQTGDLWGLDNGIDFLGDEIPPEELNKIEQGKQYGWPHVWGDGQIYPQSTPTGNLSKEAWRAQSTPMVLGYKAHAAPMQLVFYRGGSFPHEYNGDAFATMRGSWNRNPASGYEIVRIHFEKGQARSIQPFVTGFLTDGGTTHIARPMGLAVAKDGSLLMGDDANGYIYRISYGRSKLASSAPPAVSSPAHVASVAKQPIAITRDETRGSGRLEVTAPTITRDIPLKHSAYADGVSPELHWTAVANAKSYVIILEDPDSKPISPFVHWLVWNIPSSVTSLPEGLQAQPRVTDPDGVLQGRTTRGSVGYFGPRPPVGDPVHHYHFQVFALDNMLNVAGGSERDEVLKAIRGHVLARGELVGEYQQSVAPLK